MRAGAVGLEEKFDARQICVGADTAVTAPVQPHIADPDLTKPTCTSSVLRDDVLRDQLREHARSLRPSLNMSRVPPVRIVGLRQNDIFKTSL